MIGMQVIQTLKVSTYKKNSFKSCSYNSLQIKTIKEKDAMMVGEFSWMYELAPLMVERHWGSDSLELGTDPKGIAKGKHGKLNTVNKPWFNVIPQQIISQGKFPFYILVSLVG